MDMDMDMEIDEQPAPSEMQSNVREERKRSRQQTNDTQFIICPTCKQSIPANEYSEHVRVELLKGKTVRHFLPFYCYCLVHINCLKKEKDI